MIENKLINDLKNYFEKKDKRTYVEENFLSTLRYWDDAFPITSVSRDDLESRGYDVEKITDDQMSRLARKMADDYIEQMFWQSMEIIADTMELPKKL